MRFSVITVTRNNIEGLKKTHDSVVSQSSEDYEWLVIDGASTDQTREFLQSLRSPNLRWASEADTGIYNAMNKGIRDSRGEYLIFMNAGDQFYDPNVLSNISELIDTSSADLIYGDAVESDGDRQYHKPARHPSLNAYVMFTHHQAIFYKRLAIVDGYDESFRYGADWALTTKLLNRRGATTAGHKGPICIFERGGISQREDQRRRINSEHWRTYREVGRLPLPVAAAFWIAKTQTNSLRRIAPSLYDLVRYRKVTANGSR